MLEVVHQHEKLAVESGVEFRPLELLSGACVTALTQDTLQKFTLKMLHSLHQQFNIVIYTTLYGYQK